MCADAQNSSSNAPVPDFETVGFAVGGDPSANFLTQAHAALGDVKALSLSGCIAATYDSDKNQICVKIPIYGQKCVTSPVPIPVGGTLKACFQTCGGGIIPKGVQVSFFLNGSSIYSTVFGHC